MLTYADVCTIARALWKGCLLTEEYYLTYAADVCKRMLTYAYVCTVARRATC
jgi:hypothetical protein